MKYAGYSCSIIIVSTVIRGDMPVYYEKETVCPIKQKL